MNIYRRFRCDIWGYCYNDLRCAAAYATLGIFSKPKRRRWFTRYDNKKKFGLRFDKYRNKAYTYRNRKYTHDAVNRKLVAARPAMFANKIWQKKNSTYKYNKYYNKNLYLKPRAQYAIFDKHKPQNRYMQYIKVNADSAAKYKRLKRGFYRKHRRLKYKRFKLLAGAQQVLEAPTEISQAYVRKMKAMCFYRKTILKKLRNFMRRNIKTQKLGKIYIKKKKFLSFIQIFMQHVQRKLVKTNWTWPQSQTLRFSKTDIGTYKRTYYIGNDTKDVAVSGNLKLLKQIAFVLKFMFAVFFFDVGT